MNQSSSIISQLLKNSDKQANPGNFSPEEFGANAQGLVPIFSSGDTQMSGTIKTPTIVDKIAIDMDNELIPTVTELSQESKEMLEAVDPKDPNSYVYPRYYGQVGMKRGFTYMYTTNQGNVVSVKFTNGVFVTKDIWLISKMDADIKRTRGGIGSQIQNITEAYYNEMAGKAAMYKSMIMGTANSTMGDSHKWANLENTRKLQETLMEQEAKLKEQQEIIRQLEAGVVANRGENSTLNAPTSKPLFGN
jgi:hypothetical protein